MSINFKQQYNPESRALVWSLRKIQNFVYNSCLYEFEDIINEIDKVDLITPPQLDFKGKVINRLIKTQARIFKPVINLNPYIKSISLEQEYDIFFATLDFPLTISSINSIKNLRQKCKFTVGYIVEIWNSDLPKLKNILQFWSNFDLICIGHSSSSIVENVQNIINVPCIYLAPGVDAIKFHPNLEKNSRSIDICSLGRRSNITHEALLKLAEEKQYNYYYDRAKSADSRSSKHQEHRTLTANLLKSSRYFITNHAKVNQPKRTQGQMEIGYRFFEGAAAGNVLIGYPPDTESFRHYFDWKDAVIPIAFDEPHINKIILELDSQPEYLRKIQINNVINSLRKHDWVYRWEQVLTKLGLPTSESMEKRKATLEQMAQSCEKLLSN